MIAFPCFFEFTCAILSISSISRLTIAYVWSIGVGAVCILVTRVVSFTLVNVYEITDKKKMGFRNHAKIVVHKPLPCLKSASWIARTRDCRPWRKKVVYAKNLSLNNFKSGNCLTYSKKLKYGLPRYQNKH